MPTTISGAGLSFCGRPLTPQQIDLIRQVTREFCRLPLTELAHTVCELLDWKRPRGSLKARECYLFLQDLQQRGWLPWLPAPRSYARHAHHTALTARSDPQAHCSGPLSRWLPLEYELIQTAAERKLFEQYIQRYHYLGYRIPCGAQLRYCIRSRQAPQPRLACLLFTSAAWKMAPREAYIGWTPAARRENLAQVVNQSRFLILPWVEIPHLASHVLSGVIPHLRRDWEAAYGAQAVLLETLVDRSRYQGTCYRAANWTSVGFTQGRGRMDHDRTSAAARKEIFLYPLVRDWRRRLCAGPCQPAGAGSERAHTANVVGDL